jgi:hypothetical protein
VPVHDRAAEYARCARLLQADAGCDGAAALFDTALNNALAAIVAKRWPGQQYENGRFVRSARQLLSIIEEHGDGKGAGVVALPDLNPPPPGADFMGPLSPRPTIVRVETLRDAIGIAAIPRHGRPQEARPLESGHVEALIALNDDAALHVSFSEDLEEWEERVTVADANESRRARAYLEMLSSEEREHREATDYVQQYREREFESYLGEFAWGTCVACSYTKSPELADIEGRDEAIDRAVNDPD